MQAAIFDPNTVTPEQLKTVGDLGPESVLHIGASASPNGKDLLVVANEVSGSVSVFQVIAVRTSKARPSACSTQIAKSAEFLPAKFAGLAPPPGRLLPISPVDLYAVSSYLLPIRTFEQFPKHQWPTTTSNCRNGLPGHVKYRRSVKPA
jgi:hypothetical protein